MALYFKNNAQNASPKKNQINIKILKFSVVFTKFTYSPGESRWTLHFDIYNVLLLFVMHGDVLNKNQPHAKLAALGKLFYTPLKNFSHKKS